MHLKVLLRFLPKFLNYITVKIEDPYAVLTVFYDKLIVGKKLLFLATSHVLYSVKLLFVRWNEIKLQNYETGCAHNRKIHILQFIIGPESFVK